MARRVGLCASFGALLTLGFAGIPAANAQSIFSSDFNGDFATWSESRRVRALDAINRADLSKSEIASILPLLRDLEESERIRRSDFARLEQDLLFAERGDISVEARIAEINAAHNDRVSKIWMTISDRIGAGKSAMLRSLVDDTAVIDQTAYYQSDRIARMDSIMAEWDRLSQERVARYEEYNRMVAEQVAAAERHNQMVAQQESEAARLRAQAVATVPAPAPEVTVTETVVQQQPARAFRSTPAPTTFQRAAPKPKRTKRVRGLG